MRWWKVLTPSKPFVAALWLGALIGVVWLTKTAPRARLSKAEKREQKRLKRKKGRRATSKRANSTRYQARKRLREEIGVEEFNKIIQDDKRQREEQLNRLQAAIDDPDSLQLAVDLNWAECASGKEFSSLVKQLCYVYNRVKASMTPPALTLTSYRGRVAGALDNAGAGAWIVNRNPLGVFTVFDPSDVVYLSPDADEPLEEVLATDVYVVGGIVDRNLSKGMSLAAAEGGRARSRRLPFDEYLPEVSRKDRVLTVCACVGVLVGVYAGEDWREALEKSIPKRRGIASTARKLRGGAWRGSKGSLGSGWGVGKVLTPEEESGSSVVEDKTRLATSDGDDR